MDQLSIESTTDGMVMEHRSRRQHMCHWLIGIGVFVVLAGLTYGFYTRVTAFGWGWTGFVGGYSQMTVKRATEERVYLASKTLWDWMQLLLVPAMLAGGVFWLNLLQKNRDEKIAEKRAKTDRDITTDNQREAALQSYSLVDTKRHRQIERT